MHAPTDCYVCGSEPHAPTAHAYWSNRAAAAWFAAQPQGGGTPHCDESLRFPGED